MPSVSLSSGGALEAVGDVTLIRPILEITQWVVALGASQSNRHSEGSRGVLARGPDERQQIVSNNRRTNSEEEHEIV